MNVFQWPVRRPVAVAMFFLGLVLLGLLAWFRIPVELLPALAGDELHVQFVRPGSEPEIVEREILIPLEAKARTLPGVEETWGEIRSSGGEMRVRLKQGVPLKLRELELNRLAADLAREQPPGTEITVSAQDLSFLRDFAMFVHVTGGTDRNALRHFVQENVEPALSAVPGVAQVIVGGGGDREVTVEVDPDRCAALGVTTQEVVQALQRVSGRIQFVGSVRHPRIAVLLDGRVEGPLELRKVRVRPGEPVELRHVADLDLGAGREEMLFRVNGRAAVGVLVYQEQGENLVRLGERLRRRLESLERDLSPYGIGFSVGFDASEFIGEQLDRLEKLALSGFLIALAVLYLFVRQGRGVGVVGVGVPVSLLVALAMLYLSGESLNLITLFGLAVGIGMLVDNSIVVFEAVQRRMERGAEPGEAAESGARRTVRAILAATATNAVVFLPLLFLEDLRATERAFLGKIGVAYLLPLAASVVVAVGLVPLLSRYLAAPAARRRLERLAARRRLMGDWSPPDPARTLFTGLLSSALRRPGGWIAGVALAVLLSAVAAVYLLATGAAAQEAGRAEQVQLAVEVVEPRDLDAAAAYFERLEQAAMAQSGVERVESFVREEGGSITVHLAETSEDRSILNAARVRQRLRAVARDLKAIRVLTPEESRQRSGGGQTAVPGTEAPQVVLSGPDPDVLERVAQDVEARLESLPEVALAWSSARRALWEIHVEPREAALRSLGLHARQVLPVLAMARREGTAMRTGVVTAEGREVPLVVRAPRRLRDEGRERLRRLRVEVAGRVARLDELAEIRTHSPPPSIYHHNGRREISVYYRLQPDAPATGPAREELEAKIREAIRSLYLPPGITLEIPDTDSATRWFKKAALPVLFLLFAVLAVTFESVTLPLVVLVSLPLTLIGAVWALVLAGFPVDVMALVGILALVGLTVNPAILLVDRMQQYALAGGASAGAAALAAVRERTRPVLMTSATTLAGLWPLALSTGRENEIWPPFATVVMGGLAASTVLTLLVIPVGYVAMRRLEALFGRLGPYLFLGWVAATAGVVAPLVITGALESFLWQVVVTMLVGAGWLLAMIGFLRPRDVPEPAAREGEPPEIETRFLRKVYGVPGPVRRALLLRHRFSERVRRAGGRLFEPAMARERLGALALLLAGSAYLAWAVQNAVWTAMFTLLAAVLAGRVLLELRRARGCVDPDGRPLPGGPESLLAAAAPWVAVWMLFQEYYLLPTAEGTRVHGRLVPLGLLALAVLAAQRARVTARRIAEGALAERAIGAMAPLRTAWRRLARRWFGLDLPAAEVVALRSLHFHATPGMIGVLGPNGAGKTTLLRQLAGILEPTRGRIYLGGLPLQKLRTYLGRWVGYLPQDYGLPNGLTAREYLDYYALLYDIRPRSERARRVQSLLEEVGLAARADDRIGRFSGGMRQRVAVARTLLRLPPVIIVDEPTVGLDPRERIRFRNLLTRLARGRVVLFSTHVVEDVAVACPRVLVLSHGEKVFDGPTGDLARHAEGKVWSLETDHPEDLQLPEGALVADQAPDPSGRWRLRILAEERPAADARPEPPTLEDGYLLLTGATS